MSRQFSRDFLIEVAKGNIAGHSFVHKFGKNEDLGTGAREDIWDGGGTYGFWPLTAQSMELLSSSANDTGTTVSSGTATGGSTTSLVDSGATFVTDGVAVQDLVINSTNDSYGIVDEVVSETELSICKMYVGDRVADGNESGDSYIVVTPGSTGAGAVHVVGLSSSYVEQYETVITNGTGTVNLTKSYIRMYRKKVVVAGSNEANVGTITTRIQGGGTTSAIISPDNGQTLMTIYTIPSGKTGFLLSFQNSFAGTIPSSPSVDFQGKIRECLNSWQVKEEATVTGNGPFYEYYFPVPLPVYEKSDIRGTGLSSVNNTIFSSKFTMLLVDNDVL